MIGKKLMVNGIPRTVFVNEDDTLSTVLRNCLSLTGVKVGCDQGQCGACNVILNSKLVRSCITKMKRVPDDSQITTIEGIGTPDNLHPIQAAWIAHGGAQCGFCTPGFIVSSKALLDTIPDPTREDIRDWFQKHKNACRCTGYKQLVDSVMDAAKVLNGKMTMDDLLFKIPEDGRIWGTKYPRPTAVAKVTGTLDYGADLGIKMPEETLRLALVQAKVSHANIKSIDTSEAEKMPGVYKVVTHKDVQGKNRISGLITFPTNKGDGWDRPILCDEKVFQYGDAIAIVCADTEKNAKAAADKVKVDLELLPEYMSAPAAMAEDAMQIHPGTPNVYYIQKVKKGEDTAPIFESADVTIEDDFYTSRQPHMPIEPDVGFAFQGEDGALTIHSKSIGIHLHLAMIAPGLGIAPEKLTLVQNPTGGTFGYKFSPTMEALVGVAAMATGKPVFLNYDWQQQQTYTGKRSPFLTNLRLAADKDGTLKAMESDWSVDHGPYSEFGDLLTLRGAQFAGAGYNIPNIRGEGRTVCTNHAWGSAFRGYGAPEIEFPSEVLMDMLAEKLGMDPFDLRYKNVYREGATTPTGQTPDSWSLPEMFDILKPKYEAAKAQAAKKSTDTEKCGVGIAVGVYGCGLDGPDTSEAHAELNEDNTITVFNSWEDHGQGADMGTLGTAHEALRPMGIAPDQIKLVMNDTSKTPNSGPAGGSRSQVVTGQATKAACELLMGGMKKSDGTYRTYEEMKAENIPVKYTGAWTAPAKDCDENGQGSPFAVYMYGLFMTEVCVEIATGKTKVTKITAVADVGKINNKLVVDGQMYGGLAQGVGFALTEDYEDIKKHSTMMGAGFPYIKDIPDEMELIYVQAPREHGPFGAAGVGELPLTAPHAAIINGIYNACGARVKRLPATPDKVLAELKG
ncbi:aldehyde oxidoreductase [Desulfobacter hydrogenophilus]|uniref:2Fe-2S iron-sulfur cluster binding domain-containing protein n=1 Tax=Desulfobacter hydrogenophilus TaxID=2291 RepID=A0A328FHN1_9BACT|nr:molybdopterin-dependent aldehyde oxidoreductase [Desulfobacter hydrogenophilus]NDY70689.1 molybdopterin-dependent oxidoreductase [Desulfobacter hydrogenophilus]QBH12694.1 2Fe-2S iron-sulfur cluster binding domain-containing protein [Desulfobacter hydrogenophilus]RAM03340.1 aldehyde oxidoreductase [Desulfobacter hydrogenophilus]